MGTAAGWAVGRGRERRALPTGTYLAQWRKVDGAWLIQAELFVPTHCRGSAYCAKRP